MAKKEFIQIARDYRSLGLSVVIPVVLLVLFGFALSLDVERVPMIIWNQDGSQGSKDFILNFKNSRYFKVAGYSDNYAKLQDYLDRKKAMMAMVIPSDFSRIIAAGAVAPVQLLVDGSDSNTATIAIGYVNSVVSGYNAGLLLGPGERAIPAIDLRPRVWFNERLESRNYIIPGLIAVIMMIIAAQLSSVTIAREWENGTMEQLISTPIRKGELILGKLAPYFVIGILDLLIAVGMGQFVFGVRLQGSLALLLALSSIFLIGALGIGIYFSITAKNQRLATQLAIVSTFLPTFLLSGFIYPIYNMPAAIQLFTYLLPARYFISILKGIYLKGSGLGILWPQALVLSLFAVFIIASALRGFKKKLA